DSTDQPSDSGCEYARYSNDDQPHARPDRGEKDQYYDDRGNSQNQVDCHDADQVNHSSSKSHNEAQYDAKDIGKHSRREGYQYQCSAAVQIAAQHIATKHVCADPMPN